MPLPNPGDTWPPKAMEPVHRDITAWSAWWSGDPDALSEVYGGGQTTTERSFSQRSGVWPTIQRWFWGTPPKAGEQRTKLHLPLASEIPAVSADLIFGQPPTITCSDKATQERIDELLGDRAGAMFHEAAESCSALGHVYLRAGWDVSVDPDEPLPSTVDADAAYPVYRYGRLAEVTFCREWNENGTVLRHLEFHEPGMIWHAAYLGDTRNLGRMVPLGAHPETADLVGPGMVADDRRDGLGVETGIPGNRLDVVGVPNARSRTWRHLPTARDLGRSDLAGLEPTLDALDDVYSSWMRDIRHGRSRIHLPAHMLDSLGPGKGAVADVDRELYVTLNSMPGELGQELTATQFQIRWEEHQQTADQLAERIVSGAGYSPQTFGFDADSALTATESWSRQTRTQNTRNGKIRHWRPAVEDFVWVLLAIDNHVFRGRNNLAADIEVAFADVVAESALARAQTAQALRAADAASTRTLVEMVHNDWDGDDVDREVLRIERGDEKVLAAGGPDDPDAPDGDVLTGGEGDDEPDPADADGPAKTRRARRRNRAA